MITNLNPVKKPDFYFEEKLKSPHLCKRLNNLMI